jgi:murein DD-endopeptidase MepM/ murein hydrolase activator NlpD
MRLVIVTAVASLLLSVSPARAADSLVARIPGPSEGMDIWLPAQGSAQLDSSLRVGTLTGVEDAIFLRFNLSGLPQRANKVNLSLYLTPYSGTTWTGMNLSNVTSQWHSSTIKWSAQPSSVLVKALSAPRAAGWYSFDVTDLYNQWRSGSSLNFGLRLSRAATANNAFNMFSSSHANSNRPELDVYYTPQAKDGVPKLKWPLATPRAKLNVNTPFGGVSKLACKTGPYAGQLKQHPGVDYSATKTTPVYAAEDGIVKESVFESPWAYNIVLEHNHPIQGKYTTVYWHVNPVSEASSANIGGFVPRGLQIGSVADLGSNTHFHFGVRIGPYQAGLSGLGALPYAAKPCDNFPVFAAGFIDPEKDVLFQ